MSDPADLGVLEAAALLRNRALSSAELTEACLARIEERNGGAPTFAGAPGAVNAWARLYPERARESARLADERLSAGEAPLLCGIPLALKDLYAMEGLPLTASSRVLEGNVAAEDAAVWARLRDQGMVALGHTHTHEFAAGGTTDQVGNPWALDRVAGGSSGGSAAALAASMTPAALGCDTCGSLRIPSACCGTSAIKPTHGLLPLGGIIPLAPTLDHPGPMARTIADCAALLAGMAAGGSPVNPHGAAAGGAQPAPAGPLARPPAPGGAHRRADRPHRADAAGRQGRGRTGRRPAGCERLGARVVAAPAPWHQDWDDLSRLLLTDVVGLPRPARRPRCAVPAGARRVRRSVAGLHRRRAPTSPPRTGAPRAPPPGRTGSPRAGSILLLEPTLPIVPYGRGPGYDRGHAGGAGRPDDRPDRAVGPHRDAGRRAAGHLGGGRVADGAPRTRGRAHRRRRSTCRSSALPAPRWAPTAAADAANGRIGAATFDGTEET